MRFQWDNRKNASNLEKHDFDFADAHLIWNEMRFTRVDDRFDYGETRFVTLETIEGIVVFCAWTLRQTQTVRVISPRKATLQERNAYYTLFQNQLGQNSRQE